MTNQTINLAYVVRNNGEKRPFGLIFTGVNDRPTGLSGASKLLIATSAAGSLQSQTEFTSDPFNVSADFLASLGINADDVKEGSRFDVKSLNLTGEDVFGMEVAIQTVETTEKPHAKAKPVMNPTTGEIMQNNGKDIYRVKTVVTVDEKVNTFLKFDKAVQAA
jgi:hypothetical protein